MDLGWVKRSGLHSETHWDWARHSSSDLPTAKDSRWETHWDWAKRSDSHLAKHSGSRSEKDADGDEDADAEIVRLRALLRARAAHL